MNQKESDIQRNLRILKHPADIGRAFKSPDISALGRQIAQGKRSECLKRVIHAG